METTNLFKLNDKITQAQKNIKKERDEKMKMNSTLKTCAVIVIGLGIISMGAVPSYASTTLKLKLYDLTKIGNKVTTLNAKISAALLKGYLTQDQASKLLAETAAISKENSSDAATNAGIGITKAQENNMKIELNNVKIEYRADKLAAKTAQGKIALYDLTPVNVKVALLQNKITADFKTGSLTSAQQATLIAEINSKITTIAQAQQVTIGGINYVTKAQENGLKQGLFTVKQDLYHMRYGK